MKCQWGIICLAVGNKTHIFFTILIDCYMDSAEGTATNLLLYDILINAVFGTSIILTGDVLGSGIECFLLSRELEKVQIEVLIHDIP